MKLDHSHPMNQGVIRHCGGREGVSPIAAPAEHPDPYLQAGSHPDVVERLWDGLGSGLPVDCRALVYGTPALVDPEIGVVLALAFGTQYALRVPDARLDEALNAGCRTGQDWTGGGRTDVEEELGRGWVFGCWADDELRWVGETRASVSAPP